MVPKVETLTSYGGCGERTKGRKLLMPVSRTPSGGKLILSPQVVVEELAAVVTVKASGAKGNSAWTARGRQTRRRRPCSTRPGPRPLAGDVGLGQAPEEVLGQLAPQWTRLVGFQRAGPGHVPSAGADRDLGLEQPAGFGTAPAPQRCAVRAASSRSSVAGLIAHRSSRCRALSGPWESLVMRQPQRQGRGEAFAAGLLSGQPDGPHHRLNALVARGRTGMRPPVGRGHRLAQELDAYLRR